MIQTITKAGVGALAEALLSSDEIIFTKCAIGHGAFDPDESDPSLMTELVRLDAYLPVTVVRREESGVAVVCDLANSAPPGSSSISVQGETFSIAGGTAIAEFGVYARIGSGPELLFTYAYEKNPEVVPHPEDSVYERRFVSHIAMATEMADLVITYTALDELIAEAMAAKIDWESAGASGGVAQLDEGGKVPLSQLPDGCGREYATAEDVYAHFGFSEEDPGDAVPDSEVADDSDVRAALTSETFDDGEFSVPASMIAEDDEIRRYLNQQGRN